MMMPPNTAPTRRSRLLGVKGNFGWKQNFLMAPATSPRIREGDRLMVECAYTTRAGTP